MKKCAFTSVILFSMILTSCTTESLEPNSNKIEKQHISANATDINDSAGDPVKTKTKD